MESHVHTMESHAHTMWSRACWIPARNARNAHITLKTKLKWIQKATTEYRLKESNTLQENYHQSVTRHHVETCYHDNRRANRESVELNITKAHPIMTGILRSKSCKASSKAQPFTCTSIHTYRCCRYINSNTKSTKMIGRAPDAEYFKFSSFRLFYRRDSFNSSVYPVTTRSIPRQAHWIRRTCSLLVQVNKHMSQLTATFLPLQLKIPMSPLHHC